VADFGFGDFNLDNLDFGDFGTLPDFSVPDFPSFSFPDLTFPNFDFSQQPDFNLGFDPSLQLPADFTNFADPFAMPTGNLDLPTLQTPQFTGFSGFPAPPQDLNFAPPAPGMVATDFGAVPSMPTLAPMANIAPGFDLSNPGAGPFGLPSLWPAETNLGGSSPSASAGGPWDALSSFLGSKAGTNTIELAKLGTGVGGALLSAFGPHPTVSDPLAQDKLRQQQAQFDAQMALEREKMQLQRDLAAQQMSAEEAMARKPLMQTDPRFSTLYDETTGAQKALSPNDPQVQQMTQQIYGARLAALEDTFAKQKDAILENANRLGTNPAAELAQINQKEQDARNSLFVESQQAALAFAQSRLDPMEALLKQILGTVV
jgi:hypothetical protein